MIMVQVTQTDDEIKIIIELNRLITRKPDVVLLPMYVKFNNPPIFFERHLTQEIDEMASFCRIFKNEARLLLIKKQKGIWPEIFQKLTKEELFQKRLEIADQIVERNKERDKQALERYEHKRRVEIDKEIKRETAMRERIKQFEENACMEAMMVGTRKETHEKQKVEISSRASSCVAGQRSPPNLINDSTPPLSRVSTPTATVQQRPVIVPLTQMRTPGKINVDFSDFAFSTPKRESQQHVMPPARPFMMQNKQNENKTFLESVDE